MGKSTTSPVPVSRVLSVRLLPFSSTLSIDPREWHQRYTVHTVRRGHLHPPDWVCKLRRYKLTFVFGLDPSRWVDSTYHLFSSIPVKPYH